MKKIYIIAAIVLTTIGCSRNNNTELGPAETVDAFYKAIFSGDFDRAKGLCAETDTEEYLARLQDGWAKSDESVKKILPATLSECLIEVTGIEKDREGRTIFYKLSTTDGQSKEKIATLRKEEGAWKITAIIDKH